MSEFELNTDVLKIIEEFGAHYVGLGPTVPASTASIVARTT